MEKRQFNRLDQIIMNFDVVMNGSSKSHSSRAIRGYPGESRPIPSLSEREKKHVSGLMRVNHAGEIAAQALYKAQTLTAIDDGLKKKMEKSAKEEVDHLDWCERRLNELDSHVSYLSPLWYLGSFGIGLIAGSFGDRWNLGFIAETEHQVIRHLDKHLQQLPEGDVRSRAILEQMRKDESDHASKAEMSGAESLPKGIKGLMTMVSKIMTKTAYHI